MNILADPFWAFWLGFIIATCVTVVAMLSAAPTVMKPDRLNLGGWSVRKLQVEFGRHYFIISTARKNGVASHTSIYWDENSLEGRMLYDILTVWLTETDSEPGPPDWPSIEAQAKEFQNVETRS